jgi:hypothetical protein
MSIKQKQLIEYAVQDLVAMLVERRGLAIQEAMQTVYRSRFHAKLQDVETGLYLEGSEYLYTLLCEELASKLNMGV